MLSRLFVVFSCFFITAAYAESPPEFTGREHTEVMLLLSQSDFVNEREFIISVNELLGNRVTFLIPRPKYPIADLPVERCQFSASHNGYHPAFFGHVFSQIKGANALLQSQRFDLLVFRLDVLPLVQLYITRKHRIPYALKTLGQGPIRVFRQKGGWLGKIIDQPNQGMFRKIVSDSMVGDACSLLHVEYLQEVLVLEKDHVVWIDNGVNVKRFYPIPITEAREYLDLTQYDPIIGYTGARPWERGGMQIIEATPKLLAKYPNLGVVILGDGKELENMKARAVELGVRDRCRFEGYVPFDTVPKYVNSLDVGVSVSLQDERRLSAELKVRQYLACGKPVIVSPGSNEFVFSENFGSIVGPTDIESTRLACADERERPHPEGRASEQEPEELCCPFYRPRRINAYLHRKRSVVTILLRHGLDLRTRP